MKIKGVSAPSYGILLPPHFFYLWPFSSFFGNNVVFPIDKIVRNIADWKVVNVLGMRSQNTTTVSFFINEGEYGIGQFRQFNTIKPINIAMTVVKTRRWETDLSRQIQYWKKPKFKTSIFAPSLSVTFDFTLLHRRQPELWQTTGLDFIIWLASLYEEYQYKEANVANAWMIRNYIEHS